MQYVFATSSIPPYSKSKAYEKEKEKLKNNNNKNSHYTKTANSWNGAPCRCCYFSTLYAAICCCVRVLKYLLLPKMHDQCKWYRNAWLQSATELTVADSDNKHTFALLNTLQWPRVRRDVRGLCARSHCLSFLPFISRWLFNLCVRPHGFLVNGIIFDFRCCCRCFAHKKSFGEHDNGVNRSWNRHIALIVLFSLLELS